MSYRFYTATTKYGLFRDLEIKCIKGMRYDKLKVNNVWACDYITNSKNPVPVFRCFFDGKPTIIGIGASVKHNVALSDLEYETVSKIFPRTINKEKKTVDIAIDLKNKNVLFGVFNSFSFYSLLMYNKSQPRKKLLDIGSHYLDYYSSTDCCLAKEFCENCNKKIKCLAGEPYPYTISNRIPLKDFYIYPVAIKKFTTELLKPHVVSISYAEFYKEVPELIDHSIRLPAYKAWLELKI